MTEGSTASATTWVAGIPAVPGAVLLSGPQTGLRERKKVATRRALGVAAMRLAVARGLDNVLVEDIAEAAGVSARTFNNYFSSKYEAICALAFDRAIRVGAALRERPDDEPLWTAITAAVMAEYGSADRALGEEWMAGLRLVISTPALRGEYLKVQAMAQYSLAEAIALRLGTGTASAGGSGPSGVAGGRTAAHRAGSAGGSGGSSHRAGSAGGSGGSSHRAGSAGGSGGSSHRAGSAGGSGGSSPRAGSAGGSGGSSPRAGSAGGSGGSSPRAGSSMFPRILAAAVTAAVQAAMERWLHSDPPVPLAPIVRRSLRQLADGMLEVLPPSAPDPPSGG